MTGLRQFLKSIPAVEYGYGYYRLQRYRRSYGADFARLLDAAPSGMSPLQLANSLNEFEWLVHHPLFPAGLLECLVPEDRSEMAVGASGEEDAVDRALHRAFANFARGYQVEQALAAEWQRVATISDAVERRLTEFLNQYVTYALRTFAVHLEMHGNPDSTDTIRMARILNELESEEGELLDIGCAFVPLAERYVKMRRWVGLDLSLPALAIGRIVQGVSADSLVCGYSEELPLPDASFDVVVSSEVLEHTPRPRRMIAEIARVLRPGGKAILSVPQHIVDYQDGRQQQIGPTDSTHRFHFHSLQELQSLFQDHGLTVERLQADPHYIFTLRRSGDQAFRVPPEAGTRGAGGANSGVQVERTACPEHLNARTPERLTLACPDCRSVLQPSAGTLDCPRCETRFVRHDGVPVLLPRRLRSARLDLNGAPAGGSWQSASGAGLRKSEPSH